MRVVLKVEGVCVVDEVFSAPLTFTEKSYDLGACTQMLYAPPRTQAPYLRISGLRSDATRAR